MLYEMNKEDRLQTAEKLINEMIKTTENLYADNRPFLRTVAWGWRGERMVGSNHADCFYYSGHVIKVLNALDLDYYLTLTNDEDGNPTPCIVFY